MNGLPFVSSAFLLAEDSADSTITLLTRYFMSAKRFTNFLIALLPYFVSCNCVDLPYAA